MQELKRLPGMRVWPVLAGLALVCACGCNSTRSASLTVTGGKRVAYKSETGERILVTYYDLSDDSLSFVKVVMPDGRTYTLPEAVSASGARYCDGRSLEWWTKGDTAFVEVMDAQGNWDFKYRDCREIRKDEEDVKKSGTERDAVPKELTALLDSAHLSDSWEVDRAAKPLFLPGDFDGDGKGDYAVCLKVKRGDAATIAVLFGTGEARLVASEQEIGDNYPGPEWQLHPRKEPVRSRRDLNEERRPPLLCGDAIELARPESSSALLYWEAGHLKLYWLSD